MKLKQNRLMKITIKIRNENPLRAKPLGKYLGITEFHIFLVHLLS